MRSSPFLFGWMPIRRMSSTVAVVKEYIERNTFLTIAVWMGVNWSNESDGCRGEFRLYSRVLLVPIPTLKDVFKDDDLCTLLLRTVVWCLTCLRLAQ